MATTRKAAEGGGGKSFDGFSDEERDAMKEHAKDLKTAARRGSRASKADQGAQKFKSRYATLGFSDQAALDDGAVWPTSYALTKLTAGAEKQITALVKQAVS